MKANLENIIKERLKLETNKRILDAEFGISFATLDKLKNPLFLHNNYQNFDKMKKDRFLITVGGRVNYRKTQEYFDNLVRTSDIIRGFDQIDINLNISTKNLVKGIKSIITK